METYKELLGRTITGIFESEEYFRQKDGIPGAASFFDIVIELDNSTILELGAHEIIQWNKKIRLHPYEKQNWVPEVVGNKISKILIRDSEEYYDGSLTLIMDNDVILEHQSANGDQVYISNFDTEAFLWEDNSIIE